MDANSIQAKAIANDDINSNLLKFANEFLEKLILHNQNLTKKCSTSLTRLEGHNAHINELRKKSHQHNSHTTLAYTEYMNKNVIANISSNMQNAYAGQKMLEYMEHQNSTVQEPNVQEYDEYTMMPYHDVESKINKLINDGNKQINETAQIYEKTKMECSLMKKESQEIQQEIEKLNIYQNEQRIELQRHEETNWENPILQQHSFEQKIAQLQKEIDELESKIKSNTN